jgi:predicted DsbA family dithiol-disulfide isomerase
MEYVNKNYGFLVGDQVMNNLFKLYFENAKDISNDDILIESLNDITEINNNDKDNIKTFLKTNQFQTEVMNADKLAKSSRINGVPHITFIHHNGSKLASLSGAQGTDVFVQLLLDYLELE